MTPRQEKQKYNMKAVKNPFPGLRPFGTEESHLFFGREGQSEQVLEYLSKNRFAAITGASGSGKSSLIYCGVIPLLYGGFIRKAGSNWKIITTRPGNSPVENLAGTLAMNEPDRHNGPDLHIRKKIIHTILRRSSHGLIDAISQTNAGKDQNLLILIDQFEELFRYKESRKDTTSLNETEAFIKLLVNAINQEEQPVYLVITMRSDFIGECSQFHQLTQLINISNFLIPQMTREDYREAILGPVAVGGAKIDPQLVQQILNTIGNKGDQLPILQHAMMRTWDFWSKHNNPDDPVKVRDYEAAGKMGNALSMHANEAYEELSDTSKQICKTLFKTLTEKGADNKGIRHPARVADIALIANATDEEVIEVADKFRARGRAFITPTESTPIDRYTILDISHESLMRIWDKLKVWVDEEAASVQMYLRLTEAASLYQLGKTSLWRPPDLQLALNWRNTQKPTLAWAKRYNPAFEKVMVFLDASEKKFRQEEQNKVRVQRRALDRTRRFAMTMGIVAILFLALLFYANIQRKDAIEARKDAESWAMIMEGQKDEALEESQVKEIERLQAKLVADSAEREKIAALMQTRQAQQQTQEAFEVMETVTREKEESEKTAEIAMQETRKERQQRTEAEKEALEAERERRQALAKRMLSIAQSLAVKVSQVNNDKDLKALLALQAYKFNTSYGGTGDQTDIYSGLYDALRGIKGRNYNSYGGHSGAVHSLSFLPRSTILYSSGSDGKILNRNVMSNSKSPRTLIDNSFINHSLAISPNGRWLGCGTGTSGIQLFNLNQQNSRAVILEGHNGWVGDLDFTPDGNTMVSTSTDKTIVVWNLVDNTNRQLVQYPSKINTIAVSPDGRFVIGGTDDGNLVRWRLSDGAAEILFRSSDNTIHAVAFNNYGSRILFGDRTGNLTIINAVSKQIVLSKKAHSARILDLSYSPDGKQIVTSSYDGTIKIWDAAAMNERPVVITEHESWILSVAYSPDGKYIASSGQNGDIYIWPAKADIMANNLCADISRNMTTAEWQTYVGMDIEYQETCPGK